MGSEFLLVHRYPVIPALLVEKITISSLTYPGIFSKDTHKYMGLFLDCHLFYWSVICILMPVSQSWYLIQSVAAVCSKCKSGNVTPPTFFFKICFGHSESFYKMNNIYNYEQNPTYSAHSNPNATSSGKFFPDSLFRIYFFWTSC